MTPTLTSLDHLVLTVADLTATVSFYTDVLGMVAQEFEVADGSTRTSLLFGAQKINLHQAGSEFKPHGKAPTPGSGDLCFLTEASLEDWEAQLDAKGVLVEEGPVQRSGAVGPIMSLYIRDPDGNLIEISVPVAQV
ncbi:VOC family protein [Litoreibacter arenae]|uniref:Biphenyl-2,3-diol 1,2-dioxygenase III-related protein n=1 Tax=Litoreibacter arenae DSM 19593 TaxID=1123360 RepID=S9RGR6_9RHOB|nr:VOC family protein [Litoreibacter arenae]EPX77280.1 biphenyl-2,3-diol 1,2-dioxygenase III-related protein [Litoreibacter arenae DSM 19593]